MTARPPAYRTCTRCGETKPLYQFARDTRLGTRYAGTCRACSNQVKKRRDER